VTERRRARLDAATRWLLSGGSVLFFGPDDASTSAALDVLIAAAHDWRVLRSAAPAQQPVTAYAGLAGLLAPVTAGDLAALPVAYRESLTDIARPGPDGPLPPQEVRHAALDLVRTLGRAGPLLLVIDHMEGMDEASAAVLRFVATQVGDLPVRMAAGEHVTDGNRPRGRELCPSPLALVRLSAVDARQRHDGARRHHWL